MILAKSRQAIIPIFEGYLPSGIAKSRQAIWRLRIGYVLVSFAYDSVRQLAEYWRALVRRFLYVIFS